ncbi:MAG: peptidogalycan biosysnthesis protein [Gammaproteobacteria bacterium]
MDIKIFDTIRDVPKQEWNQLLNGYSFTYSYEFWDVIEQSGLNDFCYQHALIYDDAGDVVASTSFYSITTDIAIFAPSVLRSVLSKIRQLFPNFLKIRMLECGTPITLNKPFVASERVASSDVVKAISDLLLRTARDQGHLLVLFRDLEPASNGLLPGFKVLGYHIVDSLPTTYMEVAWPSADAYLASMKSYYRSKLLKHLRINHDQGVWHELRENFDELAAVLCDHWQVVHSNADEYQREILTPAFFKEFSNLGSRAKVLLLYRESELVGHALLLMDGDLLRWLYFGRNEASNDSLYIYVGHKVVETAITLGAKRIELGLTTYSIKKDLGAYMSPIKLALRSPWGLINPFIGMVYPLLNHTPQIKNKNIFKATRASPGE